MWHKIGMIWLLLGCVFEMLFIYDFGPGQVSWLLGGAIGVCLLIGVAILYAATHRGMKGVVQKDTRHGKSPVVTGQAGMTEL